MAKIVDRERGRPGGKAKGHARKATRHAPPNTPRLIKAAIEIAENPLIPAEPTVKQLIFLADERREGFYGGAAGGGKTVALLMAALMQANSKNYRGIIFRQSMRQMRDSSGMIPLSQEWISAQANWADASAVWQFKNGGRLEFRHMSEVNDHLQYKGLQYHFIGYDEVTDMSSAQYAYMFSRCRKAKTDSIPLKVRSAGNPGGQSHAYFKERFITGADHGQRFFVSARMEDNRHLDSEEYRSTLSVLPQGIQNQLANGDWDADSSTVIKREWLVFCTKVERPQADYFFTVADTAQKATVKADFSVFITFGFSRKRQIIFPVRMIKEKMEYPELVEAARAEYASLAKKDGVYRGMFIEDKSSGTSLIQDLKRGGRQITPIRRGKENKLDRVKNVLGHFSSGNIIFTSDDPITADLIKDLVDFPNGVNDDTVDVVADALGIAFHSEKMKSKRGINPNLAGGKPRIRQGTMLGL